LLGRDGDWGRFREREPIIYPALPAQLLGQGTKPSEKIAIHQVDQLRLALRSTPRFDSRNNEDVIWRKTK
jgi:hypothetical protein